MKAMIYSDLAIAKTAIIQMTIIMLIISAIMTFSMENIYVVFPMVACGIPFFLTFTLMAYDMTNGWERFRLTMPMSRSQVIRGRYLSTLLLVGICLVLATLLTVVMALAVQAMPISDALASEAANLDIRPFILLAALPVGFLLLATSVVYPLVARFGFTQAVRLIPIAFFLLVMFGSAALGGLQGDAVPALIADAIIWAENPANVALAGLAIIVLALAINAVSCAIAVRCYEKREF